MNQRNNRGFERRLRDFEMYSCSSFVYVASQLVKKYPDDTMVGIMSNEQDFMDLAEKIRDAAEFMNVAWDRGNDVMVPLMTRIIYDVRDAARRVTSREERLFAGMEHLLGEDLVEFISNLHGFDWFYSYSDDIKVYRNGQQRQQKLIDTAKEKGGLWQKAYDYYFNKAVERTKTAK